jgi:hypothetical protein
VNYFKFAKSHEWAKLDGDIATIGISSHAQKELGDIVFVELPEKGDVLEAGKTIAAVESVKAAADVYSPVSGEVISVNCNSHAFVKIIWATLAPVRMRRFQLLPAEALTLKLLFLMVAGCGSERDADG